MRILFFSRIFGHTTFIGRQVAEVAKVHEVCYLYVTRSELYETPDVPTRQVPFRYPRLISRFVAKAEQLDWVLYRGNMPFRKALQQTIREFKPDLIHCQFGYEALMLTENLGRCPIPVLIHFRGYDASKKLRFGVYVNKLKRLLSCPQVHAAFVCRHLLQNLERKGIAVPQRRVIYSNTDTAFFTRSRMPRKEGKIRLVQVSTLREKKGHEYTLHALRLLIDKYHFTNFEFVLTDFNPNHTRGAYLLELIQELQLTAYVRLEGHLQPAGVKALLEDAHAFLLHSVKMENGDEEGIPNALMEAMAMELPVVSTRHSGIPELVEDGVNGLLVPERDIAAYAAAIYKIVDWPLLPHNRLKIEQQFSSESHMQALLQYYAEITGTCAKQEANGY